MEKRLFTALFLSFVVLYVWSYFVVGPKTQNKPNEISEVPAVKQDTIIQKTTQHPDIVVGADGTIHVSSSRFVGSSTSHDRTVYYARKVSGGVWDVAIVSSDFAGGTTSISLGAQNLPHISHRYLRYSSNAGDSSAAHFVKLTPGGVWESQPVSGQFGSDGQAVGLRQRDRKSRAGDQRYRRSDQHACVERRD